MSDKPLRRRKPRLQNFQMPGRNLITQRATSITNSFAGTVIPMHWPTQGQVDAALHLLGMPNDPVCAYCGDPSTEWDHLRPLIVGKRPTGFITEIDNLVPACGKCNQSKGNKHWKDWMLGPAPKSPSTRGISDVAARVARLDAYEASTNPTRLDFETIVGTDRWQRHLSNLNEIQQLMVTAEAHAASLRALVAAAHPALSGADAATTSEPE